MKKVVSFMKVLAMLIVPVLLIASCSGKNTPVDTTPAGTHEHSYVTTVIAPTCTDDGYTLHTCSCGDTFKSDTVAKLGHSFGAWVVTKEPTETETGLKTRTCSKCNETETQEIAVKVTEHVHTYGNWQVAKNPTDKAEGLLVKNCTDGDNSITATIPALNTTDYTKGSNSVDSTCKTAGVYEYVFTKDNQSFSFKIALPMLEHELVTEDKAATCTEAGYHRVTCKNCDYKEEETIRPLGHTWDHDEATCEYAKTCTVCNVIGEALKAHNGVAQTSPATCTEDGKIAYICSYCNKTLSEEAIPAVGHNYGEWHQTVSEEKNEKCEIVNKFERECLICNHKDTKTDILRIEHEYESEVTKEALCNQSGVITYTCKNCQEQYEKTYENTSAHEYVSKGTSNNVETFECNHCHNTKTVLSYKEETKADVNKDMLENEIALKNASLALDKETVAALPDDVTIKAETIDKNDIVLDSDKADKIGNSTIYNFGMNSGDNTVSKFEGVIKITVPYVLKDGENPEEIAIWYIDEDGNVEAKKAKYINGFAEFETDHFSYYTVVRLSGKELCAVNGHVFTTEHIKQDCFHEEYDLNTCKYCGTVEKENIVEHNGHVYKEIDHKDVTCLEAGYTTYKCENCDASYTEYVLAPGHDYQLSDDTVFATCQHAGHEKYVCSVCNDTYEVTTAQQSHQFKDTVTKPTCTEKGYTTHTCRNCDAVIVDTYTNPTGHNYVSSVVEPTCTENGYTLNKCTNCDDEYKTNETAPQHKWDISAPTCGKDQICTICGEHGLPATGEHVYNSNGVCIVCGDGCTHAFEDTTVEPTCTEDGYTLHTCQNCGLVIKDSTVAHLGHEGNIVCTRCGELTVSEEFISNLLNSYKNNNSITIASPYSHVTVYERENEQKGDLEAEVILTDIVLTISLDENKKLIAYGTAKYEQTEYNNQKGYATAAIIIKNNKVYLKASESYDVDPDEINVTYNSSFESYDSKDHYYVANLEDFLSEAKLPSEEEINQILEQYKDLINDVTNVLNTVYTTNKPLLKKLAINVLDKLFILTNNGNTSSLVLNINYFIDIYNYAKNHTIVEIVDFILGENTYKNVGDFINNLDEMTVGQALDFITTHTGLTIDEVVALLNKYVKLDGDTIEDVINKVLGNKSGSLVEYLKSDLFRNLKLFEAIEAIYKQNTGSELDLSSYKKLVIDYLEEYAEYKLSDILKGILPIEFNDLVKIVDGYIEKYKDIANIVITTDYVGNVTEITITAKGTVSDEEYWIADGDVTVNINFNDDVIIEDDFTAFADSIYSLDFAAIFAKNNIELVKDENGNVTSFVFKETSTEKHFETSGSYTYETIETRTSSYTFTIKGKYNDIVSDCGDWYDISYRANDGSNATTTTTIRNTYYNNLLIGTRSNSYTSSGYQSNYCYIFYNTKTQKVQLYRNYGATMHNFRLTKHTEPTGCETYGMDVYVCADCGYTKIDYDYKYHNGTTTYELVTPNSSCKDGVKVYINCDECGQKVLRFISYYHGSTHTEYKLKDDATNCEEGIIVMQVCDICGETAYSYESTGHFRSSKEISLADYGFEGNLIIDSCACGENSYTHLNTSYNDSKREKADDITIDGVTYSQELLTYYNGENTFVVRTLYGKIKGDNCEVNNLTITQYGYKEDGTYLHQNTSNEKSFDHSYEGNTSKTNNPDGSTTEVTTMKCTRCGEINYISSKTYDSNSNLIKNETKYYYSDNYVTYIEEYKIINTSLVQVSNYRSYTYDNNPEQNSWNKREYNYNPDNCTRTVIYTDSRGESNISQETYHLNKENHDATCTQPGYYTCTTCGIKENNTNPHGHSFYIFEFEGEYKYICSYCGLEAPGATYSTITLEDLSEDSDTYTVGYCFNQYDDVNILFSLTITIDGTIYKLDYNPQYSMSSYNDCIYGQITFTLNDISDEIEKIVTDNNINDEDVKSVIINVNALDTNSSYRNSISFDLSE